MRQKTKVVDCEGSGNIDHKVGCVLVGNKSDMNAKRVVSYEQGLALANRCQLPFLETSAKTNQNVTQLFEGLTKQIIKLNKEMGKSKATRLPLPITFKNEKETAIAVETE